MPRYAANDIGTMVLRTTENAIDFIKQLAERCIIEVEIISGEQEARLSSLAVTSSLSISAGDFMIFDIGGSGTEFIIGHDTSVDKTTSVNIDVFRLTEEVLKREIYEE